LLATPAVVVVLLLTAAPIILVSLLLLAPTVLVLQLFSTPLFFVHRDPPKSGLMKGFFR